MPSSYVRGCALHNTFNRAINIHGVHNMTVEHTVLYNVMGGAFFLEDGVETWNTFQYNLAIFVKASSSLLNDDITPASYWVTNPDNIIQHNAAAGGTHFGYWYRMHAHPDGPSYDANICPQKVPLNTFRNNSAHSFGWFGLWIFQEYHPMVGGGCDSTTSQVAVFHSLTAWNCEKGAESVNVGAVQFVECVFAHNQKAGYEGKLVKASPQYDDDNSYALKNSIIAAHAPTLYQALSGTSASGRRKRSTARGAGGDSNAYYTVGGFVLPYGNGLVVKNVKFYNFNESGSQAFTFAKIDGTCTSDCSGYTYDTKGLEFHNSPNVVRFDWMWHGVLRDKDGTLTGTAGMQVLPFNANLDPTR